MGSHSPRGGLKATDGGGRERCAVSPQLALLGSEANIRHAEILDTLSDKGHGGGNSEELHNRPARSVVQVHKATGHIAKKLSNRLERDTKRHNRPRNGREAEHQLAVLTGHQVVERTQERRHLMRSRLRNNQRANRASQSANHRGKPGEQLHQRRQHRIDQRIQGDTPRLEAHEETANNLASRMRGPLKRTDTLANRLNADTQPRPHSLQECGQDRGKVIDEYPGDGLHCRGELVARDSGVAEELGHLRLPLGGLSPLSGGVHVADHAVGEPIRVTRSGAERARQHRERASRNHANVTGRFESALHAAHHLTRVAGLACPLSPATGTIRQPAPHARHERRTDRGHVVPCVHGVTGRVGELEHQLPGRGQLGARIPEPVATAAELPPHADHLVKVRVNGAGIVLHRREVLLGELLHLRAKAVRQRLAGNVLEVLKLATKTTNGLHGFLCVLPQAPQGGVDVVQPFRGAVLKVLVGRHQVFEVGTQSAQADSCCCADLGKGVNDSGREVRDLPDMADLPS